MRIADEERRIRVILLDIEGTTTPIDFVTKTLFPYASAKVEGYLHERVGDPEIQRLIRELRTQRDADEKAGLQPPSWAVSDVEQEMAPAVAYLRWLMARDSKCTPLKILQGKVWQDGYTRGELHGEVYKDVPRAMARWKEQGRRIAIYSSGSVLAQQLLFGTTAYGDLTRHISAFFDTQTGAKTESGSYTKIAAALGQEPASVLFLSDARKEIEVAQTAGMRTGLCIRQPGAELGIADAVFTFDDVLPS